MRLFYDIQTPRSRAEALLMTSDVLMLAAPVFLATAVLARRDPFVEMLFLLIWIAIPRAVARYVAFIEKPREALKLYSMSFVFVVLTTGLITIGWHLLASEDQVVFRVRDRTALLIVLTWCSTFLLFHRHTYRIYDFLCGAVALMGLLDGRPLSWLWIPLFFLGLFFSAVTRHMLHDVSEPTSRRLVNLQNARVLALGGALFATTVFIVAYAIHGGPTFVDTTPNLARNWMDATSEYPFELDRQSDETTAPRDDSATAFQAQPTASYSYKIPVNSMGTRPYDKRVAWTIRLESPGSSVSWPPSRTALWRATSLSSFDPVENEWVEREVLENHVWPISGDLSFRSPRSHGNRPMVLACQVEIPAFMSLVRPPGTLGYSASTAESYRLSPGSDVFPKPFIRPGMRYSMSVLPPSKLAPLPAERSTVKSHYFDLPNSQSLGIDLDALATKIFHGRSDLESKLDALSTYLQTEKFIYVRQRTSRSNRKFLDEFVLHSKTGNCTHYATFSALLLRTQRLATRFTVGFLGWDAGEDRNPDTIELELGTMHAWVEVHHDGEWIQYDPTAVVERRSPDELSPQFDDMTEKTGLNEDADELATAGDFDSLRWPESSPFRPRSNTPRIRRNGSTPVGSRAHRRRRTGRDPTSEVENGQEEESWQWFSFGDGFEDGEAGNLQAGQEPGQLLPAGLSANSPADSGLQPQPDEDTGRARLQRHAIILRTILLVIAVGLGLFLWQSLRRRPVDDAKESEEDESSEDEIVPSILPPGFDAKFDPDDPRGRIVLAYHELQADLGRVRLHRQPHQTPLEHARRLLNRVPGLKRPLEFVTGKLYGILFASSKPNDEEADEYEQACRKVRRKLS